MYIIDKIKAKDILVSEGYPEVDINQMLNDYPELYDALGPTIDNWLNKKEFVDFTYEGISLSQVMDNYGYHILVAAKALNRLLNPNLSPEEKSKKINILSRTPTYE